jgi:hypothetical protein
MLFREIITVYSENHTEYINTVCGRNADTESVVLAVTLSASHRQVLGSNIGRFTVYLD